jgi:hypothetical protein
MVCRAFFIEQNRLAGGLCNKKCTGERSDADFAFGYNTPEITVCNLPTPT